jgi:hypothetical protein
MIDQPPILVGRDLCELALLYFIIIIRITQLSLEQTKKKIIPFRITYSLS